MEKIKGHKSSDLLYERIVTDDNGTRTEKCSISIQDARELLLNHHKDTIDSQRKMRRYMASKLNSVYEYRCCYCPLSFAESGRLDTHLATAHSGESIWRFRCNFCKKGFYYRSALRQHLRKHSADRPFNECIVCGKSFKDQYTLEQHAKTHSEEKSHVFECPKCLRTFTRCCSFTNHKNACKVKI